jgi:hypothetical protein
LVRKQQLRVSSVLPFLSRSETNGSDDNQEEGRKNFLADVVSGGAFLDVAEGTIKKLEKKNSDEKERSGGVLLQTVQEKIGDAVVKDPVSLIDWMGQMLSSSSKNDDDDKASNDSLSTASMVKEFLYQTANDEHLSSAYLDRVVEQARKDAQSQDYAETNFNGILELLNTHLQQVREALSGYLKGLEFENVRPASLYYYLEKEDEQKNDEWKREAHRGFPTFDISRDAQKDELLEFYAMLELGKTVYDDNMGERFQNLSALARDRYDLIYEEDKNAPNKPAHVIAIDRGASSAKDGVLKVYLVIRGTKTMTDAITDLLCDTVDYRGFKAHSGILESGTYIASQHTPLFQKLLKNDKTDQIDLTLIVSYVRGACLSLGFFFCANGSLTDCFFCYVGALTGSWSGLDRSDRVQ